MASSSTTAALLQRYVPVLRYDSQEPYFADAASEWTDNPHNQLRRADGTVIASARPAGGEAQLSLDFLGAARYESGAAVSADDRIGDTAHDYVAQARALHAQPQYANRVYGHSATGNDGRLWLAYWFFYFYNDYNLIGPLIKAGLHEGDWEMIQLRLDPAGEVPDLAVYAQHKHAGQRPWSQVERVGDRPVVYPARGSHASYFTSGVHWTGDWFDFADGRRSGPPLGLSIISDAAGVDQWAIWPGRWGGTQPPPNDVNPLDDSSPRGPSGHSQYRHPDSLLTTAQAHEAAIGPPAPGAAPAPAPTISAIAVGRDLHIAYDARVDNPAGLVVSIGAAHDPHPPLLHQIPVERSTGTIIIPNAATDLSQPIHVSVATHDAASSPATPSKQTRA
ncbi:MAG TPA: hypothetical protein VFH80_23395 [Solirubrobacteraceae bacterium]|nr:hypothetical protein [Solirubrobacteraceae bacterium]